MNILTWNCRGAFRDKYGLLDDFNADLIIIQECENPLTCKNEDYKNWAGDFIWVGDINHKGLGVFAKKSNRLINNHWPTNGTKYFISFNLNSDYHGLATWLHNANSPTFGYIGQLWKYIQLNKDLLPDLSFVIGDFNSNKIWDVWDRWWNHSDVLNELEQHKIVSLYHKWFQEEQGKESRPTYFHQHNLDKPYHIDYMLSKSDFVIKDFQVGDIVKWKQYSDHLPLYCKLETKKGSVCQ